MSNEPFDKILELANKLRALFDGMVTHPVAREIRQEIAETLVVRNELLCGLENLLRPPTNAALRDSSLTALWDVIQTWRRSEAFSAFCAAYDADSLLPSGVDVEAAAREARDFLDTIRFALGTQKPVKEQVGTKATHSEDFTSVNWFGTRYAFSKGNQARTIEVLWQEWERGGHSLAQETIGDKIDSAAVRFDLRKTFRKKKKERGNEQHQAWGAMIQADAKGCYRLVPPNSEESPRIRK